VKDLDVPSPTKRAIGSLVRDAQDTSEDTKQAVKPMSEVVPEDTKPAVKPMSEVAPEDTKPAVKPTSEVVPEEYTAALSADPLPKALEWREVPLTAPSKGPNDESSYWWNTKSGRTQWNKPEAADLAAGIDVGPQSETATERSELSPGGARARSGIPAPLNPGAARGRLENVGFFPVTRDAEVYTSYLVKYTASIWETESRKIVEDTATEYCPYLVRRAFLDEDEKTIEDMTAAFKHWMHSDPVHQRRSST